MISNRYVFILIFSSISPLYPIFQFLNLFVHLSLMTVWTRDGSFRGFPNWPRNCSAEDVYKERPVLYFFNYCKLIASSLRVLILMSLRILCVKIERGSSSESSFIYDLQLPCIGVTYFLFCSFSAINWLINITPSIDRYLCSNLKDEFYGEVGNTRFIGFAEKRIDIN